MTVSDSILGVVTNEPGRVKVDLLNGTRDLGRVSIDLGCDKVHLGRDRVDLLPGSRDLGGSESILVVKTSIFCLESVILTAAEGHLWAETSDPWRVNRDL